MINIAIKISNSVNNFIRIVRYSWKYLREYYKPNGTYFVDLNSCGNVKFIDKVTIAPGVILSSDCYSTFNQLKKVVSANIVIGNNVFLGANVVVLPGISIGDNAIVGSGAVVTNNVDEGVVVAGNPARKIGVSEDYINKCKNDNILYDLPEFVLNRHGTRKGYTTKEMESIKEYIMNQLHKEYSYDD
jgi:maltose O-acetyltransferase